MTSPTHTPKKATLTRRTDGRLVRHSQNETGEPVETPIQVACCFPWSRHSTFISLRDDKGNEQALIEDLSTIHPADRELVEEELARRLFIPRITAVTAITRRAELFHWQVVTSAGPRAFLTTQGEHPRSLGQGRTLIRDVASDLYLIEDVASLDSRSRHLLWAYLD